MPVAWGKVGVDPVIHLEAAAIDREQSEAQGSADLVIAVMEGQGSFLYLSAHATAESANFGNGGLLLGWRGIVGGMTLFDAYAGGDFSQIDGHDYRQLTAGGSVNFGDWFVLGANYYLPDERIDLRDRQVFENEQEFFSESVVGLGCTATGPIATSHRIVQRVFDHFLRTTTKTTVETRAVYDRYQVSQEGWDVRTRFNMKALPVTMPSLIGGYTDLQGSKLTLQQSEGFYAGVEWQLLEGLNVYGKFDEVHGRPESGGDGEVSFGMQMSVPLKKGGLKEAFRWYRPGGREDLAKRLNDRVDRRRGVSVGTTGFEKNEEKSFVKQSTEVERQRFSRLKQQFVLADNLIFVADGQVPSSLGLNPAFAKGMAENPYKPGEIQGAFDKASAKSGGGVDNLWSVLVFARPGGATYTEQATLTVANPDSFIDIMSADQFTFTAKEFDPITCEVIGDLPGQTLTNKRAWIDGGFWIDGSIQVGDTVRVLGFEMSGGGLFDGNSVQATIAAINVDDFTATLNEIHDVNDQMQEAIGIAVENNGDLAGIKSAKILDNTFNSVDNAVDIYAESDQSLAQQDVSVELNLLTNIGGNAIGVRANEGEISGYVSNNVINGADRGILLSASNALGSIDGVGGAFLMAENNIINVNVGLAMTAIAGGRIDQLFASNSILNINAGGFGVSAQSSAAGSSIEGLYRFNQINDFLGGEDSQDGFHFEVLGGSDQTHELEGFNNVQGHSGNGIFAQVTDSILDLRLLEVGNGENSIIQNGSGVNLNAQGDSFIQFLADGANTMSENVNEGFLGHFSGTTIGFVSFSDANEIIQNGGDGISLTLDDTAQLGLSIDQNNLVNENGGAGLRVESLDDTLWAALINRENQLNQNQGGLVGTLSGNSAGVVSILVDNQFNDNTGSGAAFATSENAQLDLLVENGNQFGGNTENGLSAILAGSLADTMTILIENHFDSNGETGLWVEATGGENADLTLDIIGSNTFNMNVARGISIDIADTNNAVRLINENEISNNGSTGVFYRVLNGEISTLAIEDGNEVNLNSGDGLIASVSGMEATFDVSIRSNNQFSGNDQMGARISGSNINLLNVIVEGANQFNLNEYTGLRFEIAEAALLDTIDILTDNQFNENGDDGLGIINTGADAVISIYDNNQFNANGRSGVRLFSSGNSNNILSVDDVSMDGNDTLMANGHALNVEASDSATLDMVVTNSEFDNTVDGYGVYVAILDDAIGNIAIGGVNQGNSMVGNFSGGAEVFVSPDIGSVATLESLSVVDNFFEGGYNGFSLNVDAFSLEQNPATANIGAINISDNVANLITFRGISLTFTAKYGQITIDNPLADAPLRIANNVVMGNGANIGIALDFEAGLVGEAGDIDVLDTVLLDSNRVAFCEFGMRIDGSTDSSGSLSFAAADSFRITSSLGGNEFVSIGDPNPMFAGPALTAVFASSGAMSSLAVNGITIENQNIADSFGEGIYVNAVGANATVSDLTISNNQVVNVTDSGMLLISNTGSTIDNVVINDNVITTSNVNANPVSNDGGIFIAANGGSTFNVSSFANNTLSDNAEAQVYAQVRSGGILDINGFDGNLLETLDASDQLLVSDVNMGNLTINGNVANQLDDSMAPAALKYQQLDGPTGASLIDILGLGVVNLLFGDIN